MSLLDDFIDGFSSNIKSAMSEKRSGNAACRAIETCCRQLGWSIHSRPTETTVNLHFEDALIQTRVVMVASINNGAYVSILASSAVAIPAKEVPAAILGYMLERNTDPFVSWRIAISDDGAASFLLNYLVPTPGFNAQVFKMLCQIM